MNRHSIQLISVVLTLVATTAVAWAADLGALLAQDFPPAEKAFLLSVEKPLADFLQKGEVRELCRDAQKTALEFSKAAEKLLVLVNRTERPLTVLLPGYDGVFHEFRGHRTFSFSAFATQMGIGADLAPHEIVFATTDARQDGGCTLADHRRKLRCDEDLRLAQEIRPLGTVPERGVRLRFGVLADAHIQAEDDDRTAALRAAFRYMDSRKADGIVVCGDLTQNGSIPELRVFAAIWDEVFPLNRRSDGEPIEKLFVYGDHDVENFTSGSPGICRWLNGDPKRKAAMQRADIALNDRATQWKSAFREDFAPVMRKTVRGYDFVLAHLFNDERVPGLRYAEPLYIPGLEEFFATNRFDKTRPLFYIQHKILKGTVGGPDMPGQDAGRTSAILKGYPNAVAFSGHKHRSARDERMLWQGAFTAIETPGMSPLQTEPGYENGWTSADRSSSVPSRQMAHLACEGDCAQGLFVTVTDEALFVERREFLHGGEVAPPWVVKVPNGGEAAYERRAAQSVEMPRFAADAKVAVCERDGSDREGKAVRQIVVSCPPASPRAYAYEFRAVLTKGFVTRIVGAKRVFSPRCYLAEPFDRGPVTCAFALSEIPSDHDTVRFEVRPVDAFGRLGEAVSSVPRSYNPTPSCLYPF